MTRYGPMFGPDYTFLGVPACDWREPETYADADVVIIGAPFDGGTSHRPGARFGPQVIRGTDYLPHDGSRPHMAMRVDALTGDLTVKDAGDLEVFSGEIQRSCATIEEGVGFIAQHGAVPLVLGGDHTVTWPDVAGVASAHPPQRISVIHFDAHADTGDIEFGSLYGHGQPMRRLIESGAVRGDRFLQLGLRGYWPGPDVLDWMADQRMNSFHMSEIVERGLDAVLDSAFEIAMDGCDGVFLSVDIDVCDPGHAPGTGTPEPGGFTGRQLLDSVSRICHELPVVGMDIVEVSPPFDHAEITAMLGNRVVLEALSGMARRRKDGDGPRWKRSTPLLQGRGTGREDAGPQPA
ncbi:agmatinase [Actinoplanes palleronii]|uniref:Agmatinase n=1 Tax=Actinoplanes palleronii TaxID=113570 RepID=A0ABQ4BTM9_9ACTN|nr:agmatinase [Actinoplanes palleronii]GIE74026.1 agmatinase [Actinoplanes palleronii]